MTSELDALKMTVEEGAEIQDELTAAIAGLAEEMLEPCSPGVCIGHLGKRGEMLMDLGLDRYREMQSAAGLRKNLI